MIPVNELKANYYLFGGKGDVWSNTAHIATSGESRYTTLCDRPMLSSNWVRIEGVQHAGCPKCIAEYNRIHGYGDESPEEYNRMLLEVGLSK